MPAWAAGIRLVACLRLRQCARDTTFPNLRTVALRERSRIASAVPGATLGASPPLKRLMGSTASARERLERVLERMNEAARRVGRSPASVTLVAVAKTVTLDRVLPFVAAGVSHVGENRVQEALTKYSTPSPLWGDGPGEKFS